MKFPFVKRKDYEEVVDKLEALLCEATGCRLSKHTYPLHTMYKAVDEWIQSCCDEAVEEETRELKEEIEKLTINMNAFGLGMKREAERAEKAEAEIEQWKEEANRYQKLWCEAEAEIEKLHPYKLHYGNLRMEIAREVCDRLTDTADSTQLDSFNYAWMISQENIDNLLKEMEKGCEENQA